MQALRSEVHACWHLQLRIIQHASKSNLHHSFLLHAWPQYLARSRVHPAGSTEQHSHGAWTAPLKAAATPLWPSGVEPLSVNSARPPAAPCALVPSKRSHTTKL